MSIKVSAMEKTKRWREGGERGEATLLEAVISRRLLKTIASPGNQQGVI